MLPALVPALPVLLTTLPALVALLCWCHAACAGGRAACAGACAACPADHAACAACAGGLAGRAGGLAGGRAACPNRPDDHATCAGAVLAVLPVLLTTLPALLATLAALATLPTLAALAVLPVLTTLPVPASRGGGYVGMSTPGTLARTFGTNGDLMARGWPSPKISKYECESFSFKELPQGRKVTKVTDGHEHYRVGTKFARSGDHHPRTDTAGMMQTTPEQLARAAINLTVGGQTNRPAPPPRSPEPTPEQLAYCASRGVVYGGKPDHVVHTVAVAKQLGLTQKVFLAAAKRREIPLRVMKIGRRFFVLSSELENWLNPQPAAVQNPARLDCADLF